MSRYTWIGIMAAVVALGVAAPPAVAQHVHQAATDTSTPTVAATPGNTPTPLATATATAGAGPTPTASNATPTPTPGVPPTPTPTPGVPSTPTPTAVARPTASPTPTATSRPTTPSATLLLTRTQRAIAQAGSLHWDLHLSIVPPDHSQRLTHEVVDVSFRNGIYYGVIDLVVTQIQRGRRTSTRTHSVYLSLNRRLVMWSSASRRWSCIYPVSPVAPPPLLVSLAEARRRGSVVGGPTTVSGTQVWRVRVQSGGRTTMLFIAGSSGQLIRESASFTTAIGRQRAPSTDTVDYSRYGEQVRVRLPITCGR